MSVTESNLSEYGYHMVTAITQAACNSQLRQFLSKTTVKNSVYYLNDGNNTYFKVDSETREEDIPDSFPAEFRERVRQIKSTGSSLFKEFEKLKLFEIKEGDITDEVKKAYYDLYLGYAFLIEDGIPQYMTDKMISEKIKNPDFNPDTLFKVVEFQENGDRVNFNQFFKNLVIVELYENRGLHFNKVCQPQDESWSFKFDIQMNFFGGSYSNLPDEIKERIRQMSMVQDPDTLFEISQLVLDIQTLSTVVVPVIENVSNKAREIIQTDIITGYFDRLEKAGETIFGHVIIPKPSPVNTRYLFTPKRYTFTVSKNTLNYIIMFDDGEFPEIRKFSWNWMEQSDVRNGVMCISSEKLLKIVMEVFRTNVLRYLRIKILAELNVGVAKCEYSASFPIDESEQEQFRTLDDKTYYYNYEHNSDTGKKSFYIPPFLGADAQFKLCYKLMCIANLGTLVENGVSYPSINFKTCIGSGADFIYDSGHSDGIYFNKTVDFKVGIKIKSDGGIEFLTDSSVTDNKPAGIDVSGWSKFCTVGSIADVVDDMKSEMNNILDSFKDDAVDNFAASYNTSTQWVMPGNRTFTYTGEGFSTGKDFYSYVNYIQE